MGSHALLQFVGRPVVRFVPAPNPAERGWNATNLSRDQRRPILALAESYRARVRAVVCETDPETLAARNAARRSPVPRLAIERMLSRWQPPDLIDVHLLEVAPS
jgi:hypothetical protein